MALDPQGRRVTPGDPEPVAELRELAVPSPDGRLPARTYRPDAAGRRWPLPVLVYFAGGGLGHGDLELADRPCRALANATGALVASVAYRAAPEHPFPAAVLNGRAAASWFAEQADELGGDPTRIGVAGDGLGGAVAAVVAQRAREYGDPVLALQLLICPSVALAGPRLSPPRASDLLGLPPTIVVTADRDPRCGEGQAYARAMADAGVPVLDLRPETLAPGFLASIGTAAGSPAGSPAGAVAGAGSAPGSVAGAVAGAAASAAAGAVLDQIGARAREVFATAVSATR